VDWHLKPDLTGTALKHNSRTTFEQFLKQWCVALTGGIATGKSTVAGILRDMGFTVIDADELARVAVVPGSPALKAIVQAFGPGVVDSSGHLDRAKLRSLIFADAGAKSRLEAIMHPAIRAGLYREIEQRGLIRKPAPVFYEASLIFETGSQSEFREVWATHCPREKQLERLQQIRSIPAQLANQILAGQMAAGDKATMADQVIETAGDIDSVRKQVDQLAARFRN
jgi:dephospho-CoA kinase